MGYDRLRPIAGHAGFASYPAGAPRTQSAAGKPADHVEIALDLGYVALADHPGYQQFEQPPDATYAGTAWQTDS